MSIRMADVYPSFFHSPCSILLLVVGGSSVLRDPASSLGEAGHAQDSQAWESTLETQQEELGKKMEVSKAGEAHLGAQLVEARSQLEAVLFEWDLS